tara:strand:+ start:850 stop:1545 length:696 start_codon:yes stop_codon:yes gene_type:complete
MAIPKIVTPTYECELPSTKQKIKYRPFLVKEEKVLLVALESDDDNAIQDAIIQVLQNCIMTEIKVDKLPIFDFEYLYLKVRAKSVGEVINLKLKCPDDEKVLVDHALNLDDLQVKFNPDHKKEISFAKDYGITMKYPTVKEFKQDQNPSEASFSLVKDCLSMIYKGEETYDRGNIEDKELDEWIETLTPAQYKLILNWFKTMPKIEHTISYTNPKSEKDFKLKLQGIKDFF